MGLAGKPRRITRQPRGFRRIREERCRRSHMICVLFALLTASSNAAAAVLQRKAASAVPAAHSLHVSLIKDLLHRRIWLAGIGLVIAAALFQAAALATGPTAPFQPT